LDPFTYLHSLEQFGIKFGLDNISAIVAALGHPERAFRSAHIAGTNGKGSVTAMVDAALRAAGHRSARYTSPHLVDLAERFTIDGRPVARAELADAIVHVRDAIDNLRANGALEVQPTFFEATTAIAFELFRRAAVEVAVLEVGLGGRLDATNVVSPTVTAITSIAFDHQQYLGTTLREIAGEKAGIIKPGVPVVIGALPAEADAVVEEIARQRAAEVIRANPVAVASLTIGLAGAHQRMNAAVAVKVLEALDSRGVSVPREAIAHGLAQPDWPGRLDLRRLAEAFGCSSIRVERRCGRTDRRPEVDRAFEDVHPHERLSVAVPDRPLAEHGPVRDGYVDPICSGHRGTGASSRRSPSAFSSLHSSRGIG